MQQLHMCSPTAPTDRGEGGPVLGAAESPPPPKCSGTNLTHSKKQTFEETGIYCSTGSKGESPNQARSSYGATAFQRVQPPPKPPRWYDMSASPNSLADLRRASRRLRSVSYRRMKSTRRSVAAQQVAFVKSKGLKPVFHFIGARIGSPGTFQATWVNWIELAQPHRSFSHALRRLRASFPSRNSSAALASFVVNLFGGGAPAAAEAWRSGTS
jgi:hypothetical protein